MRKLQQKKREEEGLSGGSSSPNVPPSILRVKRDLQEYQGIPQVAIQVDSQSPMDIALEITPVEGFYNGGLFKFHCKIPQDYPNSPPEFKCLQRIYHPNIDPEGHVCLNILRSDWKPTLTLQLIFAGILHLFLEPNPNDPLNKEAANQLAKFPADFQRLVRNSMSGGVINGVSFDRVI